MVERPTVGLLDSSVLARLAPTAARADVCDACLGRLVAKVETGLTNAERGRRIRAAASLVGIAPSGSHGCAVCGGLLEEVPKFAVIATEALAAFEFATYLVGTKIDADRAETEAAFRAEHAPDSFDEPLNTELNREIGKRVGDAFPHASVDFRNPQITVVVDTRFDVAALQHGGIFLAGRYRKLERGIPQTAWIHTACGGRGCIDCEGAGKLYPTSVQELIEAVPKVQTGATHTAFHGAGREDIDARAVGTGRPFILELKDPRRRALDLGALERQINDHARPRVEVEGLRLAEKEEVAKLKEFRGTKTYRALVEFADAPAPETFKKGIESLRGAPVIQRTPSRVEHRRADKLRERHVLDIEVEAFQGTTASLRIKGDAGLYIKELVSGDEGRTKPSLAGLLGVAARVRELDVLAVESDESMGEGR